MDWIRLFAGIHAGRLIALFPFSLRDKPGREERGVSALANRLNNRPRRILGYRTPREVFAELLEKEQQQFLVKQAN